MTVEELIAVAEIKDVHIRFCRANDRRDEDLLRGCFHPDATIELHQPLTVDEFIALGRTILSRYTATWHNTGNQLVEVDVEHAWAEHYTTSSHRIAADGIGPERDFVVSARYVDRMVKRDGEWRIARRILLLDAARTDPVGPGEKGLGIRHGARDHSDGSYGLRFRQ